MSKTTTRKLTKAEVVEMAKKDIEAKKAAANRELQVPEKTTTTVEPAKTPETKKPKEPKKPEAPIVVDIDEIRAKLPPRVLTKDLCSAFGYTDGGKVLRKVLRAKFATPSKHEKKADWFWTKGDKVLDDILTHFAKATKIGVVAQ